MHVALATTVAMLAFAANSVLARIALVAEAPEPLSYTGVRLASGAITLLLVLLVRERRLDVRGSWPGAVSLLGYALLFSLAYVVLGAGTGALVLFASVQLGILSWAIFKGDRPGLPELLGLGIALVGLVYLLSPGLVAPDPLGVTLMMLSGLCWAAYTLIGRGSTTPLQDTGGNFIRTIPAAALLLLAGLSLGMPDPMLVGYAILSGAVASGLGYAVWYAVLPHLSRVRAAVVQLTVPVIAAIGGMVLLAEPPSTRLIVSTVAILGGVALSVLGANRRQKLRKS
jgi:drug/metabolite transporter (DMT)-like permease